MKTSLKFKKPPGTFVYTGEHTLPTKIEHIKYSKSGNKTFDSVQEFSDDYVDYINIEGLNTIDKITSLCKKLNIDDLTIEDIFNPTQRSKFEVHDNYIFIVQRFSYHEANKVLVDYISMVLFDNYIITFSEKVNRFKADIIYRIKNLEYPITKHNENYLLYALLDMMVDEEINIYENVLEQIKVFEEELDDITKQKQFDLHIARKQLVFIRNSMKQFLENYSIEKLNKTNIIGNSLDLFFSDLLDHVTNLYENTKAEIENINNLFSIFSNNVSNRMNEIMKTLTIFSAIFIPLSFFAGVFGMNFVEFEILTNDYGLYYFIGLCVLICVGMLYYFKQKDWF